MIVIVFGILGIAAGAYVARRAVDAGDRWVLPPQVERRPGDWAMKVETPVIGREWRN